MALAVTIDDAALYSYANVERWARQVVAGDNLRLHALAFLNAYVTFNDELVPNFPARDWKVPMAELAYRLPTALAVAHPEYTADVARIVYASCMAVIRGLAAGRITVLQSTDFLAVWNTAWGF